MWSLCHIFILSPAPKETPFFVQTNPQSPVGEDQIKHKSNIPVGYWISKEEVKEKGIGGRVYL